MANHCTVGTPRFVAIECRSLPLQNFKAKAERYPSAQNRRASVPEPSPPTPQQVLVELNPEQRRGVEYGVRQDCTIGPPLLLVAGADLATPTP
jgi:hypothetical protein